MVTGKGRVKKGGRVREREREGRVRGKGGGHGEGELVKEGLVMEGGRGERDTPSSNQ